MNRSIVFSIPASPVKDDWLIVAVPNQMNSVHHSFFSVRKLFGSFRLKCLWHQSVRMEDNAAISVGSKLTNFEVPNSAIG